MLRLTAHGDEQESLGLRVGPAILAPQDVGPNGITGRADPLVLDLLMKLRGYVCTDGLLQIYQCNAAQGDKGKMMAQAVADFIGVDVVAPDYSVPLGYCRAVPDSASEAGNLEEAGWYVFKPAEPVDSPQALTQRRARLINGRVDKLLAKLERLQAHLDEGRASYAECIQQHCVALAQRQTGWAGDCEFDPVTPVIIGPKHQFGHGGDQAAAKVGKAALAILGGFVGGGVSGGSNRGGRDRLDPPRDPIREKSTFHDEAGHTRIKVGGQCSLTAPCW